MSNVLHLVVDTAHLGVGDVQVGVEHTTDDLSRRITLDELAQAGVAVEAVGHDALIAQRTDGVLDLDVVVVDRHLQVFDEARAVDGTKGLGVGLLRLEVRVTGGHRCNRVLATGQLAQIDAGRGQRLGVDVAAAALAVKALGEGRLAHVARQRAAQAQVIKHLHVETGLVGVDRTGRRVVGISHRNVQSHPLTGGGLEQRNVQLAEHFLHAVVTRQRRHSREGEDVRAAGGITGGHATDADGRQVQRRTRVIEVDRISLLVDVLGTVGGTGRGIDRTGPTLSHLAGEQGFTEVLVHVADAPLVAGDISVGRSRHVALSEDVDGHATTDAAVQTYGRLQQLAVLILLARIYGLRGSRDLRVGRAVLRQLHIADDLAGDRVFNRVDGQEQTVQTHFTVHAGVLVRTAGLPSGLKLPVIGDVDRGARTPREHGVHVVRSLKLVEVTEARELTQLVDLDGRHILGGHLGLHRGRQIRVTREDGRVVGVFEFRVTALIDRVGLRRTEQHLTEQLHTIVHLVGAAQEGRGLFDLCTVGAGALTQVVIRVLRAALHGALTVIHCRRHEGTCTGAILREDAVEEGERRHRGRAVGQPCRVDTAERREGRLANVGHGDALRHARGQGRALIGRVTDVTPVLEPVAQGQRITVDLVDAAVVEGRDDVDLVTDLGTAGDRHLAVEAVAALGHTGAGAELQALELAIEHEVDHTADRVSAVLGRGTAGDDVDILDEALGQHADVDRTAAVILHHARAIEQHQRALGAQAAQVDVAGAGVAEQCARTALGRFGLE